MLGMCGRVAGGAKTPTRRIHLAGKGRRTHSTWRAEQRRPPGASHRYLAPVIATLSFPLRCCPQKPMAFIAPVDVACMKNRATGNGHEGGAPRPAAGAGRAQLASVAPRPPLPPPGAFRPAARPSDDICAQQGRPTGSSHFGAGLPFVHRITCRAGRAERAMSHPATSRRAISCAPRCPHDGGKGARERIRGGHDSWRRDRRKTQCGSATAWPLSRASKPTECRGRGSRRTKACRIGVYRGEYT